MKRTLITAAVAALLFPMSALAQQTDHEKEHPRKPPDIAASAPGGAVTGPPAAGPAMMGCPMMSGGVMRPGMMRPGMMGPGMMGPGMVGPGMMERPRSGMMGEGQGPGAMLDGLDLTEEQQARLRKIRDELRDRNWTSMGQMMREGSYMRELFAATRLDRAATEAAYKRMNALREQMFTTRLDAHAQIEASLTPDQRAKLRQRMRGGGAMMMH